MVVTYAQSFPQPSSGFLFASFDLEGYAFVMVDCHAVLGATLVKLSLLKRHRFSH